MFISKSDENTQAASLGFLLPSHEYFHQSMVVADCESELFMDSSRGLEGGAFFVATILNRKEAKAKKGKDAIDEIKDFILIKSDARFCQYFVKKYDLDPSRDNTPDLMKSKKYDEKEAFVHKLVEDALRDLLPYFRACRNEDPKLEDHPLQDGRRAKFQREKEATKKAPSLDQLAVISAETVDDTAGQIQTSMNEDDVLEQNMKKISLNLSATRSKPMYQCNLCSFQSRFKSVCITHVESCLNLSKETVIPSGSSVEFGMKTASDSDKTDAENMEEDQPEDCYWNYKNCEFLLDAIFSVTSVFEGFGDRLGCYIVNKILLPILHGLHHSNYTNTIHRFISRVLCEATPKEALKLVHERFSNRGGKHGNNIHRDKRMEYRIGTAKKLIRNLGPNFSQEAVQQVNKTLAVKEELFLTTRKSHGVDIRELITFLLEAKSITYNTITLRWW